jgi:hypothetical protein
MFLPGFCQEPHVIALKGNPNRILGIPRQLIKPRDPIPYGRVVLNNGRNLYVKEQEHPNWADNTRK